MTHDQSGQPLATRDTADDLWSSFWAAFGAIFTPSRAKSGIKNQAIPGYIGGWNPQGPSTWRRKGPRPRSRPDPRWGDEG